MRKSHLASVGILLAVLSAPSWAIPIVGETDPTNNSADFGYAVQNLFSLRVDLKNTSNYDARITGFGFDINGGSAWGLASVSGTLDNDAWSFSYDAIPGGDDREAFAITGANLWGGNTNDGIKVGKTGVFEFFGMFADDSTISNIVVRFQRTGANGQGSDKGYQCTSCGPTTSVPEPSSLALIGAGFALLGFAVRRRRSA